MSTGPYKIPKKDFTQTEFEKLNALQYHTQWDLLQLLIKEKQIRIVHRGRGRGNPTIYRGK